MKSYSSREVISILREDGWQLITIEGSHHQYKHLTIKGKITIPHPRKGFPPKTQDNILKQAGLK